MLFESIKVQGNTIVMVPSESLNSMGFGNLAMTVAYLENTKKAASINQQTEKDIEINKIKEQTVVKFYNKN